MGHLWDITMSQKLRDIMGHLWDIPIPSKIRMSYDPTVSFIAKI